jgi:hypothetical protein
MKSIFLWLFIAIGPCFALAQTKISKSFPVTKGQKVNLHFDYPKMIHISTWEGNEVAVVATVKINNGETNQAFTLIGSSSAGKISISNKIDMDLVPDSYYIVDKGNKIRFNSKKDLQAYVSEHEGTRTTTYQQKDIEISLDIKVPVNVSTEITSVYGLVEVRNFNGAIKVDATYGGIDASVTEREIGRLDLTTQYGKIYTNLTLQPTEKTEKDFFTSITALPGKGPGYDFSSTYGNIYLRSADK